MSFHRLFGVACALGLFLLGLTAPAQEKQDAKAGSLPARSFQRLGTNKFRHGARVVSLAYSPDGRYLVAGGADALRLWDAKSGDEIDRKLKEPWIQAIAFTPQGHVVATAGMFKTIRLIEIADGKELHKFEGNKAGIKALGISKDLQVIASGSMDGTLFVWSYQGKNKMHELKAHSDEITALAFHPTSETDLLATASNDRTVQLRKISTGELVHKLDAGCAPQALVFGPDGKLYSAGDDNLVRVWDSAAGKLLDTLKGHTGTVVSLLWHPDSKSLVSGSLDQTIRVWDLATKQARVIQRSPGDNDALALSPDGKQLASAGDNQTIRTFDFASGKETTPASGPKAGLLGMAVSPDGKRLGSASSNGMLQLWNAESGELTREWQGHHRGEAALAFAPDQKHLASASDTVRIWDLDMAQEKMQLPVKAGDFAFSVAFQPAGKLLAVGYRSGLVEIWDWAQKQVVQKFNYNGPVHALAFALDGSKLVVSGGTKIVVWDVAANQEIKRFDSKDGPQASMPNVASLAFSPLGLTVAAGCYDGVVRIYDLQSGKEVFTCEGHQSVPYSLAYSADGRTLLSGSFDKTVCIWEAFSGQRVVEFKGHTGPVTGVAFSADNRSVFSASGDTTILAWDVTGQRKDGKAVAVALQMGDLDRMWQAFASEESAKAHASVWLAVAAAKESAPAFRDMLYYLDPAKVDTLFRDLDSGNFRQRDNAMKLLTNYGRWMEGRYENALKDPPSIEYRRRIEQLMQKLKTSTAPTLAQERLRTRRVMMVLEQVGDPVALDTLQKLANGAPEPALQAEARASLDRLAKRAKS
jgi:WD40 repeat protein